MKNIKFLLVALVVMVGLNACSKDCGHDFIEHDYTQDIVGTWSVLGPDGAEAMVINADGTMTCTAVQDREYFETTARYELSNNRMTITWEDGTVDVGRLNVVPGSVFSLILDEETGAGYYFTYCYEDLSDEMVGSWLLQSDMTSEIHTYNEDGTTGCLAYYYHLDEQYETFVQGTYKVVGDVLFETVNYAENVALSFASRISYTPDGSQFGGVMTSTALGLEGDEVVEYVDSVVRVKESFDLAGRKYECSVCSVSCAEGKDMDIDLVGNTFNFANLDSALLEMMVKALFFNVDFPTVSQFNYSFFNAPIVTEDNKMTLKMSEVEPAYKDVVLYAFQSKDCSQLHMFMDKTAFVNFFTNMHAMYMDFADEQFDITDAAAVNAIYETINGAVGTVKLSLEMAQLAE